MPERKIADALLTAGTDEQVRLGGVVHIAVTANNGRCEIAVKDEGPGIPADVLERVFEPFFTTKHRGTGLGLPTARRIVERHGGTLLLSSSPGGGTLVVVSVPLPPYKSSAAAVEG